MLDTVHLNPPLIIQEIEEATSATNFVSLEKVEITQEGMTNNSA